MKPSLPKSYKEINNFAVVYYYAHGLGVWLLPSIAAYYQHVNQAFPLAMSLLITLSLSAISGFGLFFMALLGHEGFHGSLHKNRKVSMVLGLLPASMVPMFLSVGYNVIHWQHHLYTNTEKDPDYMLYRNQRTLISRILFGPSILILNCVKSAIKIFTSWEQVKETFPFSSKYARFFGLLNVVLSLSFMFLYVYISSMAPLLVIFTVVLPGIFTLLYWSMAPYAEHAGLGSDKVSNTRAFTSTLFNILLLNYCYHISHHLYPRVQLHRLKAVHKYLEEEGFFEDKDVVERSTLAGMKIAMHGNFNESR